MSNTKRRCIICGSEDSPDNPVLPLKCDAQTGLKLDPSNPRALICTNCFLGYVNLLIENLKTREEAEKITNNILAELREKHSVSLTKDVTLYTDFKGEVFLKVTDYTKGYWAQVPLDEATLRAILKFFEKRAEEKRRGEAGGGSLQQAIPSYFPR